VIKINVFISFMLNYIFFLLDDESAVLCAARIRKSSQLHPLIATMFYPSSTMDLLHKIIYCEIKIS